MSLDLILLAQLQPALYFSNVSGPITGYSYPCTLVMSLSRVGVQEDAETDYIIEELARKEVGDENLHLLQEQTGIIKELLPW